MRRAATTAAQSATLNPKHPRAEYERAVHTGGEHFRRTEWGRRFLGDRRAELRAIYPNDTESELTGRAKESMNWMMADAVLDASRLTQADRNSAAFGQPRRPYRAQDRPGLLYSDLAKCSTTLTAREAYLGAALVSLHHKQSRTIDQDAWMRFTVWTIAGLRVSDGEGRNPPERLLSENRLEALEHANSLELESRRQNESTMESGVSDPEVAGASDP
jgi:hypothetical protein